MRGRRTSHPGQAVPLLALLLLVMVALSALAVDGALAFSWRRNTVNAADGAALVGVRALIAARQAHGSADDINAAVDAYLAAELRPEATAFEVYYVDSAGRRLPAGSPQPIAGSAAPPAATRGVSVDVRFSFDTYMMALFGQPRLTVTGSATSRFGNSGTAVGQDLAPLGLNQTAAAVVRDPANRSGGVLIDLSGDIQAENDRLLAQWAADPAYQPGQPPPYAGWVDPATFVRQDQVRSVGLLHTREAPAAGGSGGCGAVPAGTDTLQGWWCAGTTHALHVGDPFAPSWEALEADLVGVAPVDAAPVDARWMGGRQSKVMVLPVYAEVPLLPPGTPRGVDAVYVIDHFIAVRLRSLNPGQGWMRVEYMRTFTTSGGLIGTNNNVDRGDPCEVCAVNLVRGR